MGPADRRMVRAGFVLFLLALITGLAIPSFPNTKMALAAHVTGALNALVVMVAGLVAGGLVLGDSAKLWARRLLLFGAYTNWGATCLAAAWGTSRLTPISGAGFSAAGWQETTVQVLQVALALAMLVAAGLYIVGLGGHRDAV